MTGPGDTRPGWVAGLSDRATRATWSDLSRLAPPEDGSGRPSAVLVLLTETTTGPAVVLLERAATMRRHAGQVAFPGGAVDPADLDLVTTALREADEEIGLDASSVDVLAVLPALFLPPSNFVVTPVLGYWARPHELRAMQPAEVSAVEVVSVADLVEPAHRFTVHHPSGYRGPGFEAAGLFVWGFTAGVLDAVLRMGGWEQPWEPAVLRPLPERLTADRGPTVDAPAAGSARTGSTGSAGTVET